MNRLGYLGTLGQKVQTAALQQPQTKNPESQPLVQIVEIPTIVLPEPEQPQIVDIPTIVLPEPEDEDEPEPEPIQFPSEEQYASLPILESIVSSHTESFSE